MKLWTTVWCRFLTHGVYTMGLTVGACLEHGHGHKTPVRIHQNKPFKQEIRIFLRNIPITLHPNQRSGSPPPPVQNSTQVYATAVNAGWRRSMAYCKQRANSQPCKQQHLRRRPQWAAYTVRPAATTDRRGTRQRDQHHLTHVH